MSNQSSRKFGFLAAIVVLTMILCLVMAGCDNEQATATTTAPAATTGEQGTEQVDLYWNIDRAQYDGKSEAGMSSREPAEDGYFHVRFFKDGEIVELRVADRKTVNALEVNDLMGLEFDQDGIVIGVKAVDDLPVEQIAWQFYVQSVGGKLIKTNSSASMNGMEILVETDENTGIYDMSGVTGEIGPLDKPMQGDRVMILGDGNGKVTHVFVYERPNYMDSHEGYCEHCEKDVTWLEWKREKTLPTTTGHYQLVADLKDVPQQNIQEDQKICFDLNGHRVDGASGRRIWSMHNGGIELALMDTSEAKTGRIAAHGKGDQGLCIWVRYGVFYMYGGILDGSDATTTKNGTTLNMGGSTYMYMYGGEIIGGTSIPAQDAKGAWSAGLAGTMQVNTGAKFVMYDGLIHKGRAIAAVTKYDANGQPSTYFNGIGGNIVINGGIMEMHGGTVRDGYACGTGNIHMMGKGELYIYGGLISNGQAYGKGKNGGNIYAGGNNIIEMRGGVIRNGKTMNCGGNVYFNGKFVMTDGIITDGKAYNWADKKENPNHSSRNLFGVQGDFYMYGGRVAGGVNMIDSANDKNQTTILVSGRAVIFDEDGTGPHLTLSDTAGGTKCIMYVGQLHDEAKIGISKVQAAVFTEPTNKNNVDNFVSDIAGVGVGWSEDGLVMGEVHCKCSKDPSITTHKLGCDGVQYAWAPWSGTSMPTTSGYYYLISDLTLGGSYTIPDNADVNVDLNGHTATYDSVYRIYSFLNAENSSLTITDTSDAQTGALIKKNTTGNVATAQGGIIWGGIYDKTYISQNNTINMIAGTLDASGYTVQAAGPAAEVSGKNTVFNMYGGTIIGGATAKQGSSNKHGGAINVGANNTFNMYGGVVEKGRTHSGGQGGNFSVYGTLNVYGGIIRDGNYDRACSDANIRLFDTSSKGSNPGKLNIYGGTITGGIDYNAYTGNPPITISGDAVIDKNLTTAGYKVPTISLRGGSVPNATQVPDGTFQPLIIGEMKPGASIYVTPTQAAFSTVTDKANEQYFHAESEGSSLAWIENPADFGLTDADKGKLFIGHVHCLCGGTIPSGTVLADGSTHICKPVAFAPASSLAHVTTSSNIYLTADVTGAANIRMMGGHTLNVCLNGHNISNGSNSRVFRMINYTDANGVVSDTTTADSAINITTCDEKFVAGDVSTKNVIKSTSSAATTQNGGVILQSGGTINLFRCTIDASGMSVKDGKHGGAVNITGGTFNQYPEATIIGGYGTKGTSNAHGGSVAVAGGTYNLLGGTIKDGRALQWAGNLYVTGGTFNMYDGLITGGKLQAADGTLNPNNTVANVGINSGGTVNFMGGTVNGRLQGCNKANPNVNISGSFKITDNGNIKGNTFCANLTVPNIGTLADDAKIGLMYSGKLGAEGKKVANITDLSTFSLDKVGMNVWFSGIADVVYTYELRLVGNELWAFETTTP